MLKCTMLSDQNRKWILLPNLQQLFTYDSTVARFTKRDNKGNNKITELRTIFQRESQNS
jgi:hypothetical protein